MSIYITGDTHIPYNIDKLTTRRFKGQKSLSKNDVVIICGDFGGLWDGKAHDEYWLNWLEKKNFTTLYVYGNHENFPLTEKYPVVDFMGGKAHKIRDSVFHLINGEIFEICGKRIFVMGGATSHDKEFRELNVSWWEEEVPSKKIMSYGINNLKKYDNKVDYIITHCAPSLVQRNISKRFKSDILTDYLQYIYDNIDFKDWFCGHYHIDDKVDRVNIMYDDVVEIV